MTDHYLAALAFSCLVRAGEGKDEDEEEEKKFDKIDQRREKQTSKNVDEDTIHVKR
jgi:hypothetical protein